MKIKFASLAICLLFTDTHAEVWQPLFDGTSLAGWNVRTTLGDKGKVCWRVEDGCIIADSMDDPKHDSMWLETEREFGDFELRLKFQAFRDSPGNSGVQIRSRFNEAADWLEGPQLDVHPPAPWRTGMIYDETRGVQKWISPALAKVGDVRPEMAAAGLKFHYSDDTPAWNDLEIMARGTHLRVVLNGVVVRDWDGAGVLDDATHRSRKVGMSGHIALQIHKGDRLRMRFKDIVVRELGGPARSSYQNPVIRGVNPDPSICRVGEDYYLVTSSMFFYPGLPVYHSKDLVNWKMISHALTTPAHFHLEKNKGNPMIFAATLRHHDGTFYVVTTDVRGGGNFFVTAKNPAGPWSEPVFIDQAVFDPSLFFDDDGKVYYTRRGEMNDKDIVQAEIDIKTGKLLTPLKSISKGLVSDDTEGPHLYKINGWYYLTMGEGGSRALHMQTIARARNPYGPFESCPYNPFLSQHNAWWHPIRAAGHADFVQSADGRWWTVFLATRHAGYDSFSSIGRETFLAPLTWVDDWPVVNPEHTRKLTVNAATLPLQPWPARAVRDDFEKPEPGLEYVRLAYPQTQFVSLSERSGFLRLKGQSDNLAESRQVASMGHRQEEMNCETAIQLEFSPTRDNEEAGLSVFQTAKFHYDLFLTRRNGSNAIVLRKTVGDISTETNIVPVNGTNFRMKVEATPEKYLFFFAGQQGDWQPVGSGLTQLISTEVAAVWSGILLGAYSTGNGETCTNPADVDWFEYQNIL